MLRIGVLLRRKAEDTVIRKTRMFGCPLTARLRSLIGAALFISLAGTFPTAQAGEYRQGMTKASTGAKRAIARDVKAAPRKASRNATPAHRKHASARKAAARPTAKLTRPAQGLRMESEALLILDQQTGTTLLEKNAEIPRPIASITKLMTAMVVLDAHLDMAEELGVNEADVDRVKHSSSRLAVGTRLTRREMLHLALMSSENRAAHALARTYPGGLAAFTQAMNRKARSLGMPSARFFDPTGLDPRNVASPSDLAKLVSAAGGYPLIRKLSTDSETEVQTARQAHIFRNTNPLVRNDRWNILLSKTGYIREAGRCLVMLAQINGRATAIVLMDSQHSRERLQDAQTVRRWLERQDLQAGSPRNVAVL